jgi:hypothetical protein
MHFLPSFDSSELFGRFRPALVDRHDCAIGGDMFSVVYS